MVSRYRSSNQRYFLLNGAGRVDLPGREHAADEQCADWARRQLVTVARRIDPTLLWHHGRSQRRALDRLAWSGPPCVLAPIGSGALHPVGALHAAETVPRRSAFNMAWFFLMGQTGLALGPAIAGILLDQANPDLLGTLGQTVGAHYFGIQNNLMPIIILWVAAIPGFLLMATHIPKHHEHHLQRAKRQEDSANDNGDHFPILAFIILGAVVILRGFGQQGSVAFVPLLFEQKGWDPAAYGTITSSYWIASAFSGLFFGRLADRFDRRKVMMLSMICSAPAFYFLPAYDGALAFGLAIAAGGFSGGAHSLIVVMAQDLIPMRKGFASGAILGFIFGTGAIGTLVIGAVSDQIGLSTTFHIVAVMLAVAGVLSMLLPRQSRH